MIDLAPHLSAFLLHHLPNERRYSGHTVQSYTDCFRLLVPYAAERIGVRPCQLKIEHFSVSLIADFLQSLEKQRDNTASTCNVRLAAIKSFFSYLEYRIPSCLELTMQVRTIPPKRADKPLIDWLEASEIQAILDAPPIHSKAGLRDRAMLHLCYAAALRVSELTALSLDSFSCHNRKSIRIVGKGRRERELPLWRETRSVLNEWIAVRPAANNRILFLSQRGQPLSTDGFAYILDRHVATAEKSTPSLKRKRVTPHVLRHSAAMAILHATKDVRKVALWLGHADMKTTEAYLRTSPAEKLEILAAGVPPSIRPGRFSGVSDELMRLLNGE